MIKIRYKGKWSWETKLREKEFSDLKTKTQFCRRNKIKEYELYHNGERVVMLNDRMVNEKILLFKLQEIKSQVQPQSKEDKIKRR